MYVASDTEDVASDRNRVDDPHRVCTLMNRKIPRVLAGEWACWYGKESTRMKAESVFNEWSRKFEEGGRKER